MLEIEVPGFRPLSLEHVVLDYNGTLAQDGTLLEGVESALRKLSDILHIHILTGDTFGSARASLAPTPWEPILLPAGDQAAEKLRYVETLGAARCAAIGNGRNDRLMLQAATLGIAVMQREGAAVETVLAADIVVSDIGAALELLLHPRRLMATLRS
jgi:P-type E1-E2 ATPase